MVWLLSWSEQYFLEGTADSKAPTLKGQRTDSDGPPMGINGPFGFWVTLGHSEGLPSDSLGGLVVSWDDGIT